MSVTFLVVILFILVLVIFILAFREPLAKLNLGISAVSTGSPDVRATGSPASSASPAGNQPRTTAKSLVVDGGSQEPLASPVLPGNAAASPTPTASATATPLPSATPTVPASSGKPTIPSASPSQSTGPKTSPSASPTSSAHPAASPKASPIPAAVRTDATPELKSVTLYFTKVADDGKISIEKVSRSVSFSESPLVSSIKALLKGPAGNELSEGVVSMIPAGTTLLKAWVQDSVAYLNFSESFMFNPLGGDGLRAQVRQVVWVATEFPTVRSVQILIEGKKVQYLGGDNVAVGQPLTRQSMK